MPPPREDGAEAAEANIYRKQLLICRYYNPASPHEGAFKAECCASEAANQVAPEEADPCHSFRAKDYSKQPRQAEREEESTEASKQSYEADEWGPAGVSMVTDSDQTGKTADDNQSQSESEHR